MSSRDLYVEKMKANLDAWNANIAKLEAQAKHAEADMKIKYQAQLKELEKQRSEANAKLEELRAAGDGAWEDMRAGLESAWDAMDKAMKAAASRFR